jgi:phosphatidate phosphatase APP1
LGVVYDIDGALPIGAIRHPLRRVRGHFRRDRRSVMGMSGILRALAAAGEDAPVVYLTGVPRAYARPLHRLLRHDSYPPGQLATRENAVGPVQLVRGGQAHKSAVLAGLLTAKPDLQWVLIGDDGLHDPDLYVECAQRFPERVPAVALREAYDADVSHRPVALVTKWRRSRPWRCAPRLEHAYRG